MIARLRSEQLGDAPARKLRMNGKSHIQNNFPIAPRGDFFHWSLLDIPPALRSIAAGQFSSGVTARGKAAASVPWLDGSGPFQLRQGINDYSLWFAGDPAMALLLLGMDYDAVSVATHFQLEIKYAVRQLTIVEVKAFTLEALAQKGSAGVRRVLSDVRAHLYDRRTG